MQALGGVRVGAELVAASTRGRRRRRALAPAAAADGVDVHVVVLVETSRGVAVCARRRELSRGALDTQRVHAVRVELEQRMRRLHHQVGQLDRVGERFHHD